VRFSAEDVGIADAVARAQVIDVDAGLRLRVATAPDLVILKLAAAEEPRRRSSKRQHDLADVTKLVEEHPEVSKALPDIAQRIATIGTKIFAVKLDVNVGDDPG
jgi:predicted nucleotidyltransferase